MGGRSSKTKPARSSGKSQNQDTTVVETFGIETVDEVQTGEVRAHKMDVLKSHATEDNDPHGRGVGSSSLVHGIWDGKADNNLAPLSPVTGKAAKPIELQVSSSEDEDEEEEASNHGKKRKKARKKKKPKPATTKKKLSVLKPVKPPPATHPIGHQSSVATESHAVHSQDADVVQAIGVEPDLSTSSQETGGKPDSPSRFFGFDGWKTRKNSSRSIASTREREKSTREKEKSSGSPEKAVPPSPASKVRTC